MYGANNKWVIRILQIEDFGSWGAGYYGEMRSEECFLMTCKLVVADIAMVTLYPVSQSAFDPGTLSISLHEGRRGGGFLKDFALQIQYPESVSIYLSIILVNL